MGYYSGKLMGQNAVSTAILPIAYQQVEFLGSTGTQYIDTGKIANTTTRWELKYAFKEHVNNMQNGVGISSDVNRFIMANLSGSLYMAIGISFAWSQALDLLPHVFVLDKPNNKTKYDETEKVVANTFSSSNFNIWIFNRNVNQVTGSYLHKGKCYYSKLYSNGTLIQHLIPCYRKSDSVKGMYDIIENVFYTNAGTGIFLVGSDVN